MQLIWSNGTLFLNTVQKTNDFVISFFFCIFIRWSHRDDLKKWHSWSNRWESYPYSSPIHNPKYNFNRKQFHSIVLEGDLKLLIPVQDGQLRKHVKYIAEYMEYMSKRMIKIKILFSVYRLLTFIWPNILNIHMMKNQLLSR